MRHLLKLLALSLLLAACASGPNYDRATFDAELRYAGDLAAAASYNKLHRCPAPAPCSEQAVVDRIRKADVAAKMLIDQAEQLALAGAKGAPMEKALSEALAAEAVYHKLLVDEGVLKEVQP